MAGRLRTKWVGLHSNEVFFRDTAHGFLAWAFATLISATVLASATAYLANGAVAGATAGASAQAARSANPAENYVDKLFRPTPSAQPDAANPPAATDNANASNANAAAAGLASALQSRAEILRLWTADFRSGEGLAPSDRTYVAQVVAVRTGTKSGRCRETRRPDRCRSQDRRRQCAARRGASVVLADRGAVVRRLLRKPGGGRRRRAS